MPVKAGVPLANPNIPDPEVKQRVQDLSAQKILNATRNSEAAKWAPYVRVVRSRRAKDDSGRTVFRFETITVRPNTPPNRSHYFTVRARDINYKGAVSKAPSIIIDCDCEYWVFNCEYAMWYRGAAHLLRCNKEYPIVTNPGLRVKACKHGLHSLTRLITAGL